MAFRSSPSPFQLLATLVLFALLITPMFASPVVEDHDHSEVAENGKQTLAVAENHSGEADHSDEASSLEDEKLLGTLHRRAYGYGGLGGGGYGGYGGLGRSYGYGIYRHGGYTRSGCRRASTCMCHCLDGGIVANAAQTAQSSTTTATKP